jgi:hypothetical protein
LFGINASHRNTPSIGSFEGHRMLPVYSRCSRKFHAPTVPWTAL